MENTRAKKRKFNIVDLIFIIIIVALVAVVAVKLVNNAKAKTNAREYTVVLHSDDIPDTAYNGLKVGDGVLDEVGKPLGKIVDIKAGEACVYGIDSNGMTVASPKEGYVSVDVTVDVSCTPFEHYITVQGTKYYRNASYTFICGQTKLWLRVSDIQPAA